MKKIIVVMLLVLYVLGINVNSLEYNNIELGDAYPNPFNPVTTINFSLPTSEKVSLKVFDGAGNLVKILYSGVTSRASVNWNATNVNGAKVASGVYLYRLTYDTMVITKKMVFLK